MLITRESDYALRILRALQDGAQRSAREICQMELVPQQFAYKIIKKLSRAGLVSIARGADGGCCLIADLAQVSLYDLMVAMEGDGSVSACMSPAYECPWRKAHGGCGVHCALAEVQQKLDDTLRAYSLGSILTHEA